MARLRVRAEVKRAYYRDAALESLALRADRVRRLRNALLAMALSDVRWMLWVEQNLPARLDQVYKNLDMWLMLVEAAARWRILRSHGFLGRRLIGELVFRREWSFTDRGTLSPG
jgi:hypothetical protein